jgi:hypothetical protein
VNITDDKKEYQVKFSYSVFWKETLATTPEINTYVFYLNPPKLKVEMTHTLTMKFTGSLS